MPFHRQAAISFGPPVTRMVKRLIIAIAGVFLLTFIPAQILGWAAPYAWFGLQPDLVTHRLFLWQLVTYLFLHGGFFHVIFNLFALWMFGSDLERLWGASRFAWYFFFTGIGAGICDVFLNAIFPTPHVTIGCSGAIYGLLLAYGMLFPERLIFLYFLIPVKAKWFVVIIGLIEFVSSLSPGSGVSSIAHLGGMLFGFFFLRGTSFVTDFPFRLQLRYHEWRRARLRKKFEVYIRKQEGRDDASRWVN